MKIEIWSDFVCPFCYIGKRQLDIALDNFPYRDNVVLQIKSYQLDSNYEINRDINFNELLAMKYNVPTEQVKASNERLRTQAAEIGLLINFDDMQYANTFDAHRLVKHANRLGKGSQLTDRILKAFFTESKNIGDHLVLMELAEEVGISEDDSLKVLETNKYTNAVREDIGIANEIGVQGVPFFVFNEIYALSGAQSSKVFLEVLETVWNEGNGHNKEEETQLKTTSYCCGADNCEEDDKN